MNKIRQICLVGLMIFSRQLFADQADLNILSFPAYIPAKVIAQFEHEHHIKVHFSTIDSNNDLLYTRLLSSATMQYDLITVSSYALQKFRHANLIQPLKAQQLPHLDDLDPNMLLQCQRGKQLDALPFIWGSTGILINTKATPAKHIRAWRDLWQPTLRHQVLLINSHQDVFNMLSFASRQSPHKQTPEQLHRHYQLLLQLIPNIKTLANDNISALYIDGDVSVGMAWSSDAYQAIKENPLLRYIYPKEGFAIWLDTLALTQHAPHPQAAMQFLAFISRPDVARTIIETQHVSVANRTAWAHVDRQLQHDPVLHPPMSVRQRGTFIRAQTSQRKLQETALWQHFRLALGQARLN